MGKVDWRRLFPIFLALLFCAYAAGSISAHLESRRKLRDSEIAKIVEQNYRLAATLDDYLIEQRRHVAELADGSEVRNYLANRALGMSLRYGLQASIDDIAARFRQVLGERRFGERRFITRLVFVDESGAALADVGVAGPPPRLDDSSLDGFAMDAAAKTLRIAVGTARVDGKNGEIGAWADLGALLRFLLPSPAGPLDRTLALAPDGVEIGAFPNFGPIPDNLRRAALALTPGAHSVVVDPAVGGVVVVTAAPAAQSGVTLTTLRRLQTLEPGSGDPDFLFFAAATPLLAFGAALFFERMQRRQSHLELVLKASRERLLAVTDNLMEGVVLVGPDDRILFVNRAAVRLMAARQNEEGDPRSMVGRPLADLLRLADPAADPPPWRRAATDGQPNAVDDAYLISASGAQINAALRCAPLMDPAAGPAAILSFRDIRAEKQAQRQVMQTARLVSIGELAAGVAHEINTPAQYIADNLAFLDNEMDRLLRLIQAGRDVGGGGDEGVGGGDVDYLLAEIPSAVAESRQGVEQIARIVRSVKEFAHPGGAGGAPADLNHAVETALTVSHNIWKNVLEAELDLQPDLPPTICNIGEINQVFLNLIVNAAHAVESQARPSPGRLRLRTRADGGMAEVRFEDDGPGVPADLHERIFDPFFTTKPVGKGTGQGLAICRNIVAVKHGGSLSLENREDGGAVFIVRLPFSPPNDAADSGATNPETP